MLVNEDLTFGGAFGLDLQRIGLTARHSEACQVDIWTLGPPGQVQDHQDHHQDDQEQLLDNFKEGFKRFKGGLRGLIRSCFSCF